MYGAGTLRLRVERVSTRRSTVAQVAYAAGFAHLSRFVAAYRARYGVAPSQTSRG
jgi:AraC-like DNA-binding protein